MFSWKAVNNNSQWSVYHNHQSGTNVFDDSNFVKEKHIVSYINLIQNFTQKREYWKNTHSVTRFIAEFYGHRHLSYKIQSWQSPWLHQSNVNSVLRRSYSSHAVALLFPYDSRATVVMKYQSFEAIPCIMSIYIVHVQCSLDLSPTFVQCRFWH